MDEGWQWWPVDVSATDESSKLFLRYYNRNGKSIEISQELFDRYKAIRDEYFAVQELLEHEYRRQEGLEPWIQSPYYKEEQNVETQPKGC